ncbi:hypothetical protein BDU57DRAFT_538362 [Ampelomyces quisqualis]|uniref:F-box domain-containing protein n=1 Tax=Ampelomyces quisqualis TaxID=50730 RepID=A0A6A5QJW9_AMPQU|nr:hypothetical protein BDU57DRAFT_538362 [Ampelomyces quisqualis]
MQPNFVMTNHFRLLDLPAELRNKIFEYALTCPNGLHVRTLAIPSKRLAWRHILLAAHDQHLDLLSRSNEFNQLKFVNKQLYLETAHTELKHNNITATTKYNGDLGPGYQFIAWVRAVPPEKRAWLAGATVVLAEGFVQDPAQEYHRDVWRHRHHPKIDPSISQLAKFCKAYPAVSIQYHLPDLCFTRHMRTVSKTNNPHVRADVQGMFQSTAITAGFYTLVIVGRETNWFEETFGSPALMTLVDFRNLWVRDSEIETLSVPNLRYLPGGVEDIGLLRGYLEQAYGTGTHAKEVILSWAQHGL